jgi:hypothetical protein
VANFHSNISKLYAFSFLQKTLFPMAIITLFWKDHIGLDLTEILLFLAIGGLADLILLSRYSVWWGGHSFGYRMLLEMLPAMAVFLALAWERWIVHRWWRSALFLLAVLVSFYVQLLGAWVYPTDWNSRVNINANPGRTWEWRDSELRACHAQFVAKMKAKPPL